MPESKKINLTRELSQATYLARQKHIADEEIVVGSIVYAGHNRVPHKVVGIRDSDGGKWLIGIKPDGASDAHVPYVDPLHYTKRKPAKPLKPNRGRHD